MKLGPLEIPTDLLLAPMMDVTTPPYRKLIHDIGGVGLTVTPMVFVQQVAVVPKTVAPLLELVEQQRPCAIQIVASGRNEGYIKKALDLLQSYKFDILDINAGCPAPHTMKSGGGAAFLRDYSSSGAIERLERVIDGCLKYSDHPVSVKTRLGFDKPTDILEICKKIASKNVAFLTLHGRTAKQKYGGTINYDIIRQVKASISIPVVGNGDVRDYISYKQMKDNTNCDAVMIGRAAMFDPAIFKKIWQSAQTGVITQINGEESLRESWEKELPQIREYLTKDLTYIEQMSKFWNNERFKMREIRRLSIWLIKGIVGYRRVREIISRIQSFSELCTYVFGTPIEQDFIRFAAEPIIESSVNEDHELDNLNE